MRGSGWLASGLAHASAGTAALFVTVGALALLLAAWTFRPLLRDGSGGVDDRGDPERSP